MLFLHCKEVNPMEYTVQVQFLTVYFDQAMEVLRVINANVNSDYPSGDFATKKVVIDNKQDLDTIAVAVKERLFIGASMHIGHEI
jgi:hypothetical protein